VNQLFPALLICLGAGALLPAPARADLYAFVDDGGQVHFAHEMMDDRYGVFLKCEEPPARQLSTELKYLAPGTGRLEDHILYKRVQKSPNVKKYEAMIVAEARREQLDPALVKAVIAVESAYDPGAVSSKGAIGLMQLIPGTAERYGVKKIADPQSNIGGGTHYLKDLLAMFNGNLPLALAAYNAGEGAVKQYSNAVPPYPETQQYVSLVMQFYDYFGGRGVNTVRRIAGGRIRVTLRPRTDAQAITEQLCAAQLERDPRVRAMTEPNLVKAPELRAPAAAQPAPVPPPEAAVSPSAPAMPAAPEPNVPTAAPAPAAPAPETAMGGAAADAAAEALP
jgi:hypothetical protein